MPSWVELRAGASGDLYGRLWRPKSQAIASVVVAHGLGEHGGRYEELALYLRDHGYGVFAYDHRGHGRSPGRRGHVGLYDQLLNDLAAAIQEASRQFPNAPRVLIGHSMGGNIALNLTLRQPENVDLLVLSGPMLLPSNPPKRSFIWAAKITGLALPFLWVNLPVAPEQLTSDPEELERIVHDPLRHGKISLYLGTQLLAQGRRALDAAIRLKVPTLVIHGADDPLCELEASEAIASRGGDGLVTLKPWPGMRHEPLHETDRRQVFDYLLRWLEHQMKAKNSEPRSHQPA